jgi:hypothetical protein
VVLRPNREVVKRFHQATSPVGADERLPRLAAWCSSLAHGDESVWRRLSPSLYAEICEVRNAESRPQKCEKSATQIGVLSSRSFQLHFAGDAALVRVRES